MYIVADIGGTKTRIAGSTDLAEFKEPVIFDTLQQYDEAIAEMAGKARHIAAGEKIEALAMGIPATLSRDKRHIIGGTLNIPQWKGKSIADDLERASSTRIVADNDTAVVGLGEAQFGAGKGAEILVYVTVSTGVNGVRIVSGNIDPSAFGFATGHQYLSMNEKPTTWEQLVSGRAIHERFGVNPRELGKGHPAWEELARTVAFGLHNSIVHWSPDRIVLGGSMFNEVGISVERVQHHLKEITSTAAESVEIVHSQLGDLGGLWGGLALLRQGSEGQALLKQQKN